MKKGDRSKTKASRAAKAQELLNSSSQSVVKPAAFGFGGFSGSQQIVPTTPKYAFGSVNSPAVLLHGELDAEVAQRLRQLSKRDPTTKVKALQALKVLVGERPAEEIEDILLAWSKYFQRLVMDNNRSVRMEAASFMGVLLPLAGRGLAKALKPLAGPWWLGQSDPDPDCARMFKAAFVGVFPGDKQNEAVFFLRTQVLDFLERNIKSTPTALADVYKEDTDELEERHERVVASSIKALEHMADVLLPSDPSRTPDAVGMEVVTRLKAMILEQGMLKRILGSQSSIIIRSNSYSLLAIMLKRAPGAFQEHVKQLAPQIFGGLNDKDPLTHASMWDMVLSLVNAYPSAWKFVDVRKAVVPRLLSLLRNAFYGSAEVSSPAVLPFVAQMPRDVLGPDPDVMSQLLGAAWQGWQVAGNIGNARAALAECYSECLVWAMTGSQQLAGDSYEAYCDKLLGSASVTANALNTTSASNSAANTILKLAQLLSAPGMPPWTLKLFLSAVERALSLQFAQQPVEAHRFDRGLMMLQRIAGALETNDSASMQQREAWMAELVYNPLREGVLSIFGDQEMPAPAARLLSYLLHPSKDSPKGGADLSPGAALAMFLSGPAEGPSANAMADLLLATIQRCESPAQQFGTIATNLACTRAPLSASSGNIAALADSQSKRSPKENGHAQGRLQHLLTLVTQLSETLRKSGGKAKDWRSPRLDAVAHLLLRPERLVADEWAWQVVAALINGDQSAALLSESALISALDILSSYLPAEHSREDGRDQEAELSALHALNAVIFTQAMLLEEERKALRPAALRALVAVFQVAWVHGKLDRVPSSDEDDTEELRQLEKLDIDASPSAILAQECWHGSSLAEIGKALNPELRASIRRALLHSVLHGIDTDPSLVPRAVTAARSIIKAVCADADDKDNVLDTLLQPRSGWPQYVSLDSDGKDKGKAAAESTGGRPDTLSELAFVLGLELGFNAIFYDCYGQNRIWLVAELLCFAQIHPNTGAAALESFLAEKGRLLDVPGVSAARGGLLEGTLERLLDGALGHGTGVCTSTVYAQALCGLLRQVISGSDRAVAAAHSFVRSRIAGPQLTQLPAELLAEIVDGMAKTVRGLDGREPTIEASGLAAIARQQLKAAVAAPPLMAAVVNAPVQVASCLASLDGVARCFPVPDLAITGKWAATTEEKAGLIALWQRQMAGERSVRAAAAAEKRGGDLAKSEAPSLVPNHEAATALARLSSSVVAYCWRHLKPEQWAELLVRAKEGVAAAAVIMEDQAEAVVTAGCKAATVIAAADNLLAPEASLAVLRRLSLLNSPEAAQKLQSASFNMLSELADEDRFERLHGNGEWLKALALTLEVNAHLADQCDLPRDWRDKLTEVLSEAIRLVLAAGICAAFLVATGQRATDTAAMYFDENALLWTAASRAAQAALSKPACLSESLKAADAWAADTGVDAFTSLFALMHASCNHTVLQTACLRLLASAHLLSKVATPKDDEDEEDIDAEDSSSRPNYTVLVEAGVHAQAAAIMCGVVNEGTGFSLTWALVLAYLLTLAGAPRRLLAQALGDSDELFDTLMEDVLPFLPREETPPKRARGLSPGQIPPQQQQSAAQRAAEAAQARRDGTTWRLDKELSEMGVPKDEEGHRRLGVALYRGILFALPASARSWFGRLNSRGLGESVEAYTAAKESGAIISAELGSVSGVAARDVAESAEFRVRANLTTREAVAVLSIEDSSTLEMVVKLPPSWPLRPADVECRRRVGVAEGRLRKWLLSITAFLRNQNGTLADAMALWRDNCVREFSGVEECLICYSVVSATEGKLPRLACHTCSKRFHRACLYKWFRSSGKSMCPHCQSPW